jgi:hypothetical protein
MDIRLNDDQVIMDAITNSTWDITGKHICGTKKYNLEKIAISMEYWFSWKKFHPKSQLLRL